VYSSFKKGPVLQMLRRGDRQKFADFSEVLAASINR
jgi:hypothetical protein